MSLQQEQPPPTHDQHEQAQPQHPRLSEGVFLPGYDTAIDTATITRRKKLDCRYGEFWAHEVTMDDGARYENIIGVPTQKTSGEQQSIP